MLLQFDLMLLDLSNEAPNSRRGVRGGFAICRVLKVAGYRVPLMLQVLFSLLAGAS